MSIRNAALTLSEPTYTIDPDKRGDTTLNDAAAVKAKLIAEGDAIEDPGALGDDDVAMVLEPSR